MRLGVILAAVVVGAASIAVVILLLRPGPELAPSACRPAPPPPLGDGQPARHVSPRGSDDGPGTLERPWRSLATALQRLEGGETLLLEGGTYRGFFTLSTSGRPGQPTVVRSRPGERAVIEGSLKIDASHAVVANVVVDGGHDPEGDVGVYIAGGDDVWVAYAEITGARRSGVFLGEGADDVRIVGNWIHENGSDSRFDHGIYWARSEGGLAIHNVISGNSGYGIQLYPEADEVVVRQNTVVANGRSGIIVGGEGRQTTDGALIVRNTVAYNEEYGIRTDWPGDIGDRNVVRDNVAYGNPRGNAAGEGLEIHSTFEIDPDFAGYEDGDYRYLASSLARNRGSALDPGCLFTAPMTSSAAAAGP